MGTIVPAGLLLLGCSGGTHGTSDTHVEEEEDIFRKDIAACEGDFSWAVTQSNPGRI